MWMIRMLGNVMMFVSAFLGLMAEVPDTAPLSGQLMVWAGAVVVFVVGYRLHLLGGGTFRFRDLFENE
jgi:hypothetical protein